MFAPGEDRSQHHAWLSWFQSGCIACKRSLAAGTTVALDIMMSTARSATAITVAFVLELMIDGIIDASNTRNPVTPFTLRSGVSTDMGSSGCPILQVPTGW
jgi:hypothetical protein